MIYNIPTNGFHNHVTTDRWVCAGSTGLPRLRFAWSSVQKHRTAAYHTQLELDYQPVTKTTSHVPRSLFCKHLPAPAGPCQPPQVWGTFSAYFSLLRLRSLTRLVSSCCRFSSCRSLTIKKKKIGWSICAIIILFSEIKVATSFDIYVPKYDFLSALGRQPVVF